MKKADQKIIDENEGLDPAQLLLKGLSEKGYQELCEIRTQKTQAELAATRPVLKPSGIIQPISSTGPISRALTHNDKVRIRPKNGGSIGTEMSRENAMKMIRRSPNKYEIVG